MSEKFHTQRLTFCRLTNVSLSLSCFALKRVDNPVDRFRSLCRWHDQLVSLGKRVERQSRMGLNPSHRIFLLERPLRITLLRDLWWQHNYPNILAPFKNTLYQLVRRFRDTGSVADRRRNGTPKAVTLEFVSDVHLRILGSFQKSVLRLSQQMGASRESTPKAQKSLKFCVYRVKAVQELRSPDARKSQQYFFHCCILTH